jgi:virginiamycin B lyase
MTARARLAAAAAVSLVTATVAVPLVAAAAAQATVSSSCSSIGMSAKLSVWKDLGLPGIGWLENLGFDGHGGMWVSELMTGQLVRFDSAGNAGASVAISSPGASVLGSDGRMYADFGDDEAGALAPGKAGVVSFDPTAASPTATPFASGVTMANGLAFDASGNVYVADSIAGAVDKFGPTGTPDPAFDAAAKIPGADGLVYGNGMLYVSELTALTSAIVQIPVGDPSAKSTLTELSAGGAPLKLPDDMAIGPDGALYIATATGQLIRVDTSTGAGCVLANTVVPVTSIRFPVAFAPYTASADAFVTSEDGDILLAQISGMRVSAAQPTPASQQPSASKPHKHKHKRHKPRKRRKHKRPVHNGKRAAKMV